MNIIYGIFEFTKEMLLNWPIGTVIGILMIILIGMLLFLIIAGIFIAIDSWFLPYQTSTGTVTGKTYRAPYTTMTPITIGNITTYTPVHHSASYTLSVYVDTEYKSGSICISKEFYNSINENDKVSVEYVEGRYSGDIYLKTISKS